MIYNVLKMIKIVLTFHSINLYSSSGTRFYDSNRKSKSLQQCLIQIVVMGKHAVKATNICSNNNNNINKISNMYYL